MKKTLAVLLCAALMLGLAAACSSTRGNTEGGSPAAPTAAGSAQPDSTARQPEEGIGGQPEEPSEEEPPREEPSEAAGGAYTGGRTLVVYFSATNHTEAVAGTIAQATGGDLFELVPVEPYSDEDLDWTDPDSRVSQEHADESLRTVELENAVPDGWADYDTVFIGYPIWWGNAAWPVDGFIAANDFTGKTVIPFCTSSSSGLGQSGELLAQAAGTGNWQEGQRFQSYVSEDDVRD